MTFTAKRRRSAAVAGGLGLALALTACGASSDSTGGGTDVSDADFDCAPYEQFGELDGEEVEVYTGIVAPEDQPFIDSWAPFEECTGMTINYNGSKEFEAQLLVRAQSGNAPDLAFIPQPGLLQSVVRNTGAAVPAPQAVSDNLDANWSEDWRAYGSVDGTLYGAPLGANIKSLVWYSPTAFEEAGYEVPTTWDEMIALSDQIVADGSKPWCAGFGSGEATGWPGTDWLEDVMLRTAGPEAYDQWISHEIPFNDPQVAEALATAGTILKNSDYVNAGLGEVNSIASTVWSDGTLPVEEGTCWMSKQGSFMQANWSADIGEDSDIYAFVLPPIDPAMGEGVVGGGEFVTAFNDRPATQAVQALLSSAEWANLKAQATGPGWSTANTGLDPENLESPIDQLVAETFQNPETTFRFDASDLMPSQVGSGAEWTELTNWVANDKSDQDVLNAIESAWPAS